MKSFLVGTRRHTSRNEGKMKQGQFIKNVGKVVLESHTHTHTHTQMDKQTGRQKFKIPKSNVSIQWK